MMKKLRHPSHKGKIRVIRTLGFIGAIVLVVVTEINVHKLLELVGYLLLDCAFGTFIEGANV